MQKYSLLRERLQQQLPEINLCEAVAVTDGMLALAHHPAYIQRVTAGELTSQEQKRIGFPWSPAMVERSRRSAGATVSACRAAFAERVAVNLAGGTHHAYANHGEGFCVFNDAAIAARLMQAEQRARQVAIIDLDVHQGNGTASILANDDSIFTLSLHGENNYPFQKEKSSLDISLHDEADDAAYLSALEQALASLFAQFTPQLIIYLAGADPYAGDRLGKLSLTMQGLAQRDRLVLTKACQQGIPIAVTMAGGYGHNINDTVAIHLQTIAIANEFAGPDKPLNIASATLQQ